MTKKDYIKKVTITTYWDDNFGNIDHNDDGDESDNFIGSQRVNITGGGFKNWDALTKLDYFTDLQSWIQDQVDNVHKKTDDSKKFIYSYIMGCPKSSEQMQAEHDDPNLEKKLEQNARKLRVETSNKMFGKNVVKLRKKNERKNNHH